MEPPKNIFLIGPMGAGKTSIGRRLANQLGLEFFDTDREIERRTGVDIPLIFELEGEAGFRRREQAMLAELSDAQGRLVATGGGIILDAGNRALLQERGYVVYLRASVEQQLARTARDQQRPLLQTADPRRRLQDLMTQREPLYQATADWSVDTDGRQIRAVVAQIKKHLQAQFGPWPPAAVPGQGAEKR